ncbi:adenosine kinase 2 isoform X2 [Cimex lectularius]|uniref:Adenosine kinase n=1 Tax=Cimex lectularius TaxID=79782 RepID=A0A8I6RZG1_CIMLE|nr:adenosine kinase 2 isoform X2 [Cimex lectularius]
MDGMVIAVGNPLLDITAPVDEKFLSKYGLKPNDAILATEKHLSLYKELAKLNNVEYTAGGSSQNSLRVAQWILQRPNTCVYLGCVGEDDNCKILAKKATHDGVKVLYQHTDKRPTGTCAVLISDNGHNRSLVANLAASECFTKDHLESKEVKHYISHAEIYYSSGFFLTVSIDTILELAHLTHKREKMFLLNLSAPFLATHFKNQMMQVFPYVDIVFGNETEALAFANAHNFETEDVKNIAKKMAELPKQNQNRERVVVITQGPDVVILVEAGKVKEFPVKKLDKSQIIDTNGAGDAFVGGFLAELVKGSTYDKCVNCGIWAASKVIQTSGVNLSGKPEFSK